MSRDQDDLTIRVSQIATIGCAALELSLIYPLLPLYARVFSVPVVLGLAWWLGTDIFPLTLFGTQNRK
jgi:hypothetical protein